MRVLEMVRDGKITAEEGARLLEALKPAATSSGRMDDPVGSIVEAVTEAISKRGWRGWSHFGGPLTGLRRKEERQTEGWEFVSLSDGDHGTFELGEATRVRLESEAGGIEAQAVDGAPRVDLEAADAYNYAIYVARKGDEIVVAAHRTEHDSRMPKLKVSLPKGIAHLSAKTRGGGINAHGFACPVALKTAGGGIRIADQGQGAVEAKTTGGGIQVEGTPNTIQLHTAGGGIVFRGSTNSLDAQTAGGGITIEGVRLTSGQHHAKTAGGGVRVLLTSDSSVSLDASTNAGHINVDLPGATGQVTGSRISPRYHGEYNGGVAHLELRTVGGSVSVGLAKDQAATEAA
jgi:hypothetical protein